MIDQEFQHVHHQRIHIVERNWLIGAAIDSLNKFTTKLKHKSKYIKHKPVPWATTCSPFATNPSDPVGLDRDSKIRRIQKIDCGPKNLEPV